MPKRPQKYATWPTNNGHLTDGHAGFLPPYLPGPQEQPGRRQKEELGMISTALDGRAGRGSRLDLLAEVGVATPLVYLASMTTVLWVGKGHV